MAYDILRNHWKYQTSWTDGFTCTHVRLQSKPTPSPTAVRKRYIYPTRRSKSKTPEPRNRHEGDSRPESRKNMATPNKNKPKTQLQLLTERREQRAVRPKPWTEKTPLRSNNTNKYIETYYESCLPPDIDLDDIKLHSRKFVANSRYGNIYQIKYDISDKGTDEKVEEPVTWLWEEDYKVWLRDNQRAIGGRSTPSPTFKSVGISPKGVKIDICTTRTEAGYHVINTKSKPKSAEATPRNGQRITDKPDAELFAHYNAYRLNKQERRAAAITIQTRFRGHKVRSHLDKLKRKAVLDHGKSWQNFVKEYKELISRLQSRYGEMRHSCPIVLKEIDEFMDNKYKYEKVFDKAASNGKLMKEDLPLFLKNCDLHPTEKDITTAFNTIYKGTGNTAEMVFVLDCSTSVGPIGFRCLIQFVKDVISQLEIAPDRIRVGVLPFNEDIFQSFNISTHSTKHDILNAIDAIRLKPGLTRTHLAIKEMTNMLSNSRPGVKKIGVVITDGKSSEPVITEWEAQRAINDGIDVFAIGVGESVDVAELRTIASAEKNVLTVSCYNELPQLTDIIAKTACSVDTIYLANVLRRVLVTNPMSPVLRFLHLMILRRPRYNYLRCPLEIDSVILGKFKLGYYTITERIDQNTRQLESWKHGKCRPLNRTESMEILWTLYPPPAAQLSHVRKSRWIRPIIQDTEAWSLLDEKTKSATDIRTCLRVVLQSRIDRNGFVLLPSKDDRYGVERITDIDQAVAIIEDWIKLKQAEGKSDNLDE